jgi:uncharacterized OsmC-like protein
LTSEAEGDVEAEDGVLVIKRIRVRYRLVVDPDTDLEAVSRAFAHHMPKCPVYRSLQAAIDMTTDLEIVAG